MKVSSSSILSLALVLNGAMASPLRARGYEVVTVTQFETEFVRLTSTAWVDPARYGPTEVPTTTPEPHEKNKNHVPTSTPSTTLSIPSTSSTSIPTTTSLPDIKSIPTTTIPPTTLEKSTLPVPTTSSTPPVKTEPSTTAPAPSPSPVVKSPAGGSSGSFTGDATFYNTGLGSCGIVSQDTDCIAAISAALYDSKGTGNPNNNPFCNTVILVSYKGGPEIPVTIMDRCPECQPTDLDLSPAAFTKIGASQSDGRVKVTWRYAS